ncbi:MAG: hypothetical protein J6P53_07430 [Mailhella sp.]|nr:hypothetical protein [Mailhella sp.]
MKPSSGLVRPLLAIDASGSATVLLLALPGQRPEQWPTAICRGGGCHDAAAAGLLRQNGVACAEAAIVCTPTALSPAGSTFDDQRRMLLWKGAVESGEGVPLRTLRPAAAHACPGCVSTLLADPLAAFAMTALADDRLRARCWEEGVTAVWAGNFRIRVLFLFRDCICASYEHRADQETDSIAEDIRQIQLNWLPLERVLNSGGSGCFIHHYPPEAEGFKPVYLFGPQRMRFSGMGKMAEGLGDPAFAICRGLIDGFAQDKAS